MKLIQLLMLVCLLYGCVTVSEYEMPSSSKKLYSEIKLSVLQKPISIDMFAKASRQVNLSDSEHAKAINDLQV